MEVKGVGACHGMGANNRLPNDFPPLRLLLHIKYREPGFSLLLLEGRKGLMLAPSCQATHQYFPHSALLLVAGFIGSCSPAASESVVYK